MGTTGNSHVSCKPTCTCALTHAFQQLALSSATLQIHFELNTNATALLESLLWAVHTLAAAFLRRSSTTGISLNPSDSLTCRLTFNKHPTFGDNLRNQAFLDSEASKNPATSEPAFFRASKPMTLNVLTLRWMNFVDFCFFVFSLAFLFYFV